MYFPNLQRLDCDQNKLTLIPENMNFPKLQYFIFRYYYFGKYFIFLTFDLLDIKVASSFRSIIIV